ncbi:MAG: hypothetical protein ACI8SJ_002299 [Shewanella sp.]|jgi:hypothetical protein
MICLAVLTADRSFMIIFLTTGQINQRSVMAYIDYFIFLPAQAKG